MDDRCLFLSTVSGEREGPDTTGYACREIQKFDLLSRPCRPIHSLEWMNENSNFGSSDFVSQISSMERRKREWISSAALRRSGTEKWELERPSHALLPPCSSLSVFLIPRSPSEPPRDVESALPEHPDTAAALQSSEFPEEILQQADPCEREGLPSPGSTGHCSVPGRNISR